MSRNKKILTVLSTTAITGLLLAATSSTAFAKATKIAVNSKDGKVYEYQYDALEKSAVSQLLKGPSDPGSKLYNDFLQRKTTTRALYDDIRKSYVDFDIISKDATDTVTKGKSFNLTSYMESTTTPTTTVTANLVSVNDSGDLIINGHVSETTVDMTTVHCTNPINDFSTLVSFKLSVPNPQDYTVTVKGIPTSIDNPTGTFTAYISGKVLASDIKASDFTIKKRDLSDKPEVKSVNIIDSQTIRVRFSKDVSYAYAQNKSNYRLLDNSGVDITNYIKGIYNVAGELDTSNTDTFLIKLQKCDPNNANNDWRLTNSKYTLTIKNIIDTSKTPNVMDDYTCILNSDMEPPKVTGIYANLRTSTNKDKVVVYFSEAMDANTLINKDNYKFTNGENDVKSLPADSMLTVGGDNKSVIIEFPSIYHVLTNTTTSTGNVTDVTALIVSNVKDVDGNILECIAYKSKISSSTSGTDVKENTIKTYYDGDDLRVAVQFTRAIDEINPKDFTLGGVTPTSARCSGNMVTLTFRDGTLATTEEIAAHPITYANGKTNSSPTKIDVIKSQGQNAKFAINSTTTTDETGAKVSINDDGSPATLSKEQSTIYDYQATPKTIEDYWNATKDSTGTKVYITFDTPLDINSGIKTDDFVFTSNRGVDIKADSVQVVGNTVIFKFDPTNKNYGELTDSIDVRVKSTISLRSNRDADGNYCNYTPSSDDLKRRVVNITR